MQGNAHDNLIFSTFSVSFDSKVHTLEEVFVRLMDIENQHLRRDISAASKFKV